MNTTTPNQHSTNMKRRLRAAAILAAPLFASDALTTVAQAQWDYKDWSTQFHSNNGSPYYTFNNTSAAGSISGISNYPGFAAASGCSVPTAITSNNTFTQELQIHGINGLGGSVDFTFSTGYGWGTGGRLIIGNIHNGYEYTISAWDFNNNPIDVNTWLPVAAEYPSTAPGSAGYFSTSSTQTAAFGHSARFFVNDPNADPNFGQGGVLNLGNLVNVERIRLTLTHSSLIPNAQQVDWVIFNVGTPVPASGTLALLGCGGLVAFRRRR